MLENMRHTNAYLAVAAFTFFLISEGRKVDCLDFYIYVLEL